MSFRWVAETSLPELKAWFEAMAKDPSPEHEEYALAFQLVAVTFEKMLAGGCDDPLCLDRRSHAAVWLRQWATNFVDIADSLDGGSEGGGS